MRNLKMCSKIPLKYYKLDSQPIHKKNSLNNEMMKNHYFFSAFFAHFPTS